MEIEYEGKMITVPDSVGMAALKSSPEYNAELDRMKSKGADETRTTLTGEHTSAMDQIAVTHADALEAANKVSSGKSSDAIEGLKTQIETLTNSFNTSQSDNAALLLKNKTGAVQTELINGLDGVIDGYDKQNLTRDAMTLLDPATGQFKLASGAMGTVADIVAELKTIHPDRFGSNQPNGAGLRGGQGATSTSTNPTDKQTRINEIDARMRAR